MSSSAMARKGRLVGIQVLAGRGARASERVAGPVRIALPDAGFLPVHFRTYGAMDLEGVSSRVGLVTGVKVSFLRELQRSGPCVLAFVDYIAREVLWAKVEDLAAPRDFVGIDVKRGVIARIRLPIEHNNFGHEQFLWPVDWFPGRAPIPDAMVRPLWEERTHVSERGKARDGWEVRDFQRQQEFRRALKIAAGQMDLFVS